MDFETSLGVEEQAVAEPATEEIPEGGVEEGAEEQAVTEPASTKTSADAAFAEMRRRAAEAEQRLSEMESKNAELDDALGLYFQGDDKVAQAIAHFQGRETADVKRELEEQAELAALKEENERYKMQAIEAKAMMQMDSDLKAIQAINPEIKSIDELGEAFTNMRLKGGLSAEDAYFATMAKKQATERKPATPAGKVQSGSEPAAKNFYSYDEVKAHENDPAWIDKHYDTIQKSMKKW